MVEANAIEIQTARNEAYATTAGDIIEDDYGYTYVVDSDTIKQANEAEIERTTNDAYATTGGGNTGYEYDYIRDI